MLAYKLELCSVYTAHCVPAARHRLPLNRFGGTYGVWHVMYVVEGMHRAHLGSAQGLLTIIILSMLYSLVGY